MFFGSPLPMCSKEDQRLADGDTQIGKKLPHKIWKNTKKRRPKTNLVSWYCSQRGNTMCKTKPTTSSTN